MAYKSKSRINAKGRSKGEGQYVNLSYSLLNGEAWRTLSGAAAKVWLELRTRFHGGNNGRLHMSLDEAAVLLGLGKATVHRAFRELEERHFVRCTKRGRWYGRQASEWAVCDKGIDGELPDYRWKQWQPPGPPRRSVRKWNRKTKNGSHADPSVPTTGPLQNGEVIDEADLELVRPHRVVGTGS